MQTRSMVLIGAGVLALAFGGGTAWWQWRDKAMPRPTRAELPARPATPAPTPPADAGPLYPIVPDPSASAVPLPALGEADAVVREALAALAGRSGVSTFLVADDFVRRAVVTIDNLPRPMAASRLWPVQTTPGKLRLLKAGEADVIGADNPKRYEAFVAFVVSIEPARAAALYRRLHPLFQQAYAELGYPKGHFNDRLVVVIDHLLAAPEPAQPPAVKLIEVKGEVPSSQPWLRYEYADPALESLSAGHKIMVRVGAANERRLKAWLTGLRRAIAAQR